MTDPRVDTDMRVLIGLVQSKPCLWNRHSPDYKDKALREQAWWDVCNDLDPGFEERDRTARVQFCAQIMKKWYNVRDSYVKSLKPVTRGAKSKRQKRYLYADSLSFLHQFAYPSSSQSVEDKTSDDEKEVMEHWLDETYIDLDESGNPAKRPKLEFVPEHQEHEQEENVISVLARLIQREEDEDRAFFKSITPTVKTLSNDLKFKFRIKVMQLLRELKEKDKKIFEY